jgi:Spy/CpxP family protein refolding chaperone
MKKLLAIIVLFSSFALNADAQINRDIPSSQKIQRNSTNQKRNGKMMKDINLSSSQRNQMKELHQTRKQQMGVVNNDTSLAPEQKKTKIQELHKIQKAKINSILTSEQNEKLKDEKRERRKNNKI